MCEPNHSIVQYPSQDDGGNPTESRIDAIPKPVGWIGWTKKKIGDWFHLSKPGLGHSEAIGAIAPMGRHMLPPDTKYEAQWWNRNVSLDGYFHGEQYDKEQALACAKEYANRVSIGNLTLLRQFLEVSVRKSIRPGAYFEQFGEMLSPGGRTSFYTKIKRICGDVMRREIPNLEAAIKIMMGFTRKRNLLVPEWADDVKLWKPMASVVQG